MEKCINNQTAEAYQRRDTNGTQTAAAAAAAGSCSSVNASTTLLPTAAGDSTIHAVGQIPDDRDSDYPASSAESVSPPGTLGARSFINFANMSEQSVSPPGTVGARSFISVANLSEQSVSPPGTLGARSFINVANMSEQSSGSDADNVGNERPAFGTHGAGIVHGNGDAVISVSAGANDSAGTDHLQPLISSGDSSGSDLESWPPKKDCFVDVKTMRQTNPNWLHGIRVLSSLVDGENGDLPTAHKDLLEELKKNHSSEKREKLHKTVHKVISDLADRKQLPDLASFLSVDQHQRLVISSLETSLLDLQNSQDSSMTQDLLKVAGAAQSAFLQLFDDSLILLPMVALHVMSVSAVLSRCEQPSLEQCAAVFVSKKEMKKQSHKGLKQLAAKGLQAFHEGLEGVLDKVPSFQQWSQTGYSNEESVKRKSDFTRASFCELMVHIFTILNEVNNSALDEHTQSLLMTLTDLYSVTINVRKQKLGDEPRALLDFCLVRGSAMLLQSTFDGEESQVGKQRSKHTKLITSLIHHVINAAEPSFKRCLLREIECLAFHKTPHVRESFNDLFSREKQPVGLLAQGYITNNLQGIRCHCHVSSTEQESDKSFDRCGWKRSGCTVGGKQAEMSVYIPTATCMTQAALDKCCNEHPGKKEKDIKDRAKVKEEARRYRRNLDELKELSPECKHIVKVYCYQLLPFPLYVTEEVNKRRLLLRLLDHRNAQQWLRDKDIFLILRQFMNALEFLDERNVDPRDVTAYNMIVQPRADVSSRLSLSARCSILTSSDFVLKLADLGLAHEFRDCDNNVKRVHSQGQVPLRWTAPEALFEGKYGAKNMVFSAGCLMFELWTHGCQPFSGYDQTMNTEELIKRMYTDPQDIRLDRRPCIPSDVHNLMTRCTHHDPEKRPSLRELKDELNKLSSARRYQVSAREPGVETALCLERKYGKISQDQIKRHHIPETGIPESVEDLIDAGKNSSLYDAYRASIRVRKSGTVVTDQELQAWDWIRTENRQDCTVVEEVVSQKYVDEKLPSLEATNVVDLGRMDDYYPKLTRQEDGIFTYKRELPPGQTLKEAVMNNLLEKDVYEISNDISLIDFCRFPLLSLARAVKAMHEKDWIHRDLKEDNIFVDCNDGQVKFLRTGRMVRLTSQETFVVDDVFEDSRRWLAPEVQLSGQYSKENDIHMMGTTFSQVIHIHDTISKDPGATNKDLAPYPNIEKDEVLDYIRGPGREELPSASCPPWLHALSLECRHPDPACRPTAKKVVDILEQHCPQGPPPTPFLQNPADKKDNMAATSKTTDVSEAVVMRTKTKHQGPRMVLKPGKTKQRGLWKSVRDHFAGKKSGTAKTACDSRHRSMWGICEQYPPSRIIRGVSKRVSKASNIHWNRHFVDPDETFLKTIPQGQPRSTGQINKFRNLLANDPEETCVKTLPQDQRPGLRQSSLDYATNLPVHDEDENSVTTFAQGRIVEVGQAKHMAVTDGISVSSEMRGPNNTFAENAARENDKNHEVLKRNIYESSAKTIEIDKDNMRDIARNNEFVDADQRVTKTILGGEPSKLIESSPEESPANDCQADEDVVSDAVQPVQSEYANIDLSPSHGMHLPVPDSTSRGHLQPLSPNEDREACRRDSTTLETAKVKPITRASVIRTKKKKFKRRNKRRSHNSCRSNNNCKRVKGGTDIHIPRNEDESSDDEFSSSAVRFSPLPGNHRPVSLFTCPRFTHSPLHRTGDDRYDRLDQQPRLLWRPLLYPAIESTEQLVPDNWVLGSRNTGMSSERFVPDFCNMDDSLSFFNDSSTFSCLSTEETAVTQRSQPETLNALDCLTPPDRDVYETASAQEEDHFYEELDLYDEAASAPSLACGQLPTSSVEQFSEEFTVAVQPEEHDSSNHLSGYHLFPSEIQSSPALQDARNAGRRSSLGIRQRVSSLTRRHRRTPNNNRRMTFTVCDSG